MISNYLLSFYRHYFKNKANFFIILLELVIGLFFFILIYSYLYYEYSYDKYLNNIDRVYRLKTNYSFSESNKLNTIFTSPAIAPVMKNEVPEIKYYTRLLPTNQMVESEHQKQLELNVFWVDSSFFDVFKFNFVSGDAKTALNKPNTVVITENISKKYFKNRNPIGQIIKIGNNHQKDYIVTAIIEDVKPNTHLNFEFILSNQSLQLFNSRSPSDLQVLSYVMLNKQSNPVKVKDKFDAVIDSWGIPNFNSEKYNIQLQAVTDIHLGTEEQNDEIAKTGNVKQLLFLGVIAFLILLLACLNYVNLIAMDGEHRSKEFCLRKINGATRQNLIFHLLSESVLFVFIAVLITLLLLYFGVPVFNELTGLKLYLSPIFLLFTVIGLIVLIGIISALYPAFMLSGLKPAFILNGASGGFKQRFLYRRVIMVFQFCIILIVAVCSIIILKQMNLIKHANHGYKKDDIYIARMVFNGGKDEQNINHQSIKQELMKKSGVEKVSCCDALPELGGFSQIPLKKKAVTSERFLAYFFESDCDYIETLGIKVLKGRNFSKTHIADVDNSVLINETAVKRFGFDDPIGQEIIDVSSNQVLKVIGVIGDYNFRSLYYEIEPLVIGLKANDFNFIAVKTKSKRENISSLIKNVILEFEPGYYFTPFSLANRWKTEYKKEEMLSRGFNILFFIVFIIAGVGVYVFSNYIAKKWEKSIAVRKILGASRLSIIKLFLKEYFVLIFIAVIVGMFFSYYLINLWLQNFAEKIDLTLIIFLAPSVIIIVSTLSIMMISIFKSIHANPVHSLSQES